MNEYILISEDLNGVMTVEGFFDSLQSAKDYAKENGLELIHIYKLEDTAINLAFDGE